MGLTIVSSFTLSGEAIRQTLLIFVIIFFLTSLQGYFVIYKFKLIELFHAEKKGEALPKAKAIAAIFGVVMIGGGLLFSIGGSVYVASLETTWNLDATCHCSTCDSGHIFSIS